MNAVFVDTHYYLALLNEHDAAHGKAVSASQEVRGSFLTTDFVLVELGDALAKSSNRAHVVNMVRAIRSNPRVTVIDASRALMDLGMALYESRRDKAWSLTDCISFVTMTQNRLTDALTGDHHFAQAGFRPLL